MRTGEADRRLLVAPEGGRSAGFLLSPLSVRLRQGALRRARQRYIDQARFQKQKLALERTSYLIEFFEAHPCIDCGETDPVVLEFDHRRDKLFDIGQALPYRNWQSILDEIAKCDDVCANCHRRRTAIRKGSLRAILAQRTQFVLQAGDRN